MALIKTGSINDFNVGAMVSPKNDQETIFMEQVSRRGIQLSSLKGITTVGDMMEVSGDIPKEIFHFAKSDQPRGLALKSIELTKNFDTFLRGIINPANEIYFIAWAWDLSGEAVYQYPGTGFDPQEMIFKIKAGNVREFIGQGINLFPKREVTAGMAIRIQLWESDEKSRKFGEVLQSVTDSIQKSNLNNLLSLIALTGAPGATITLIKDAALELSNIVGTILKANSNDYVDFFEGYYAADQDWNTGEDIYSGNASVLALNKY